MGTVSECGIACICGAWIAIIAIFQRSSLASAVFTSISNGAVVSVVARGLHKGGHTSGFRNAIDNFAKPSVFTIYRLAVAHGLVACIILRACIVIVAREVVCAVGATCDGVAVVVGAWVAIITDGEGLSVASIDPALVFFSADIAVITFVALGEHQFTKARVRGADHVFDALLFAGRADFGYAFAPIFSADIDQGTWVPIVTILSWRDKQVLTAHLWVTTVFGTGVSIKAIIRAQGREYALIIEAVVNGAEIVIVTILGITGSDIRGCVHTLDDVRMGAGIGG